MDIESNRKTARSIQDYVKRIAVAAILVGAFVYLGDSILIRYKLAYKGSDAALGTVQFMMAAELKNGKLDYYAVPQTETCARSLFRQLGYAPCWYASRTGLLVVGPDAQPMFLPDMKKKF